MTTKTEKQQSTLERRIRRFYDLLNGRDFERCYEMIDPRVRDTAGSVTLFQYGNGLRQFADHFGPLRAVEMSIALHLDEPSKLYEGRDFAVGKTIVADKAGERHDFLERWVREGRTWYTRSTGFIVPETQAMIPAGAEREASFAGKRARKRSRERAAPAGGGRGRQQGR